MHLSFFSLSLNTVGGCLLMTREFQGHSPLRPSVCCTLCVCCGHALLIISLVYSDPQEGQGLLEGPWFYVLPTFSLNAHLVYRPRESLRSCPFSCLLTTLDYCHSENTFPLLYSHHFHHLQNFPLPGLSSVPTKHSAPLPAQSLHHHLLCLYGSNSSRDLLWVESHSICPSESGSFHSA